MNIVQFLLPRRFAMICATLAPAAAAAATGLDVTWYTIDGGAGVSTGGDFTLVGTIGQPDAPSTGPPSGGGFIVAGGFLAAPPPCPADIDGSGDVGFSDILAVLGAWGPCAGACPQDLNGNGQVDFADILAVLGAWGPCPP